MTRPSWVALHGMAHSFIELDKAVVYVIRFQIGKGVGQVCILSPCLFSLYAEYIMSNAGLNEAQARLPEEISIASDMQMTSPLRQKVKRN